MDTKRWLLAGCAVVIALAAAVVAIVLLIVSPPIFFRLLAIFGVLMTLLSVVAMVRAARRTTTVSIKAQVLSVVISVLSVVVFTALLGVRASVLVWLVAPFVGGLVGILWCFTTRLRLEDGLVRRQGNVLSLGVWAGVFVLQQALAAALGRVPATGMVLLLLGTGIVVGQSLTLIARTVFVRSTAP